MNLLPVTKRDHFLERDFLGVTGAAHLQELVQNPSLTAAADDIVTGINAANASFLEQGEKDASAPPPAIQ